MTKQTNYLISPLIKRIQPIFAFIILPLINGITLCLADPMRENISYITNTLQHRFIGIAWALSCAIYLYIYTARFAHTLHYRNKTGNLCLALSTIGMLLSVLIPYIPETYPFLAKFHINLSMIATVLYVLVMFHILIVSYFREPQRIASLLPYYITIVGSCLLLFLLMGCVSTLLEVIFVIPMGFFLYMCDKKFDI